GRKTYESIGSKPLIKRTNIVISSTLQPTNNVLVYKSLTDAICNFKDAWIIGGGSLYEEALHFTDKIFLTISPDIISGNNIIKFPLINTCIFKIAQSNTFEQDDKLKLVIYERIK